MLALSIFSKFLIKLSLISILLWPSFFPDIFLPRNLNGSSPKKRILCPDNDSLGLNAEYFVSDTGVKLSCTPFLNTLNANALHFRGLASCIQSMKGSYLRHLELTGHLRENWLWQYSQHLHLFNSSFLQKIPLGG